jgi:hypothetical protein
MPVPTHWLLGGNTWFLPSHRLVEVLKASGEEKHSLCLQITPAPTTLLFVFLSSFNKLPLRPRVLPWILLCGTQRIRNSDHRLHLPETSLILLPWENAMRSRPSRESGKCSLQTAVIWVYVPPKLILKFNCHVTGWRGGGFSKWSGHEVFTLSRGTNAVVKMNYAPLALFLHVMTHTKALAIYRTLILDFPVSRTVRKYIYFHYKFPSLWCSVTVTQNRLRDPDPQYGRVWNISKRQRWTVGAVVIGHLHTWTSIWC